MYPHTGSTYYVYVEQQADALARDQENMKKKAKGRRWRRRSIQHYLSELSNTIPYRHFFNVNNLF